MSKTAHSAQVNCLNKVSLLFVFVFSVLWTSDPSEECTAKGHTRCFSDSLRETNSILRDQVTRSLRYSADEATKDNSADEARAGGRKTAMADVFTSPRRSSDRKRRAEEGERSHGRGLLAPGG